MSNKHLKLSSHTISRDKARLDNIWWYEESQGICIVSKYGFDGKGTDYVNISWVALRNALKRKDLSGFDDE